MPDEVLAVHDSNTLGGVVDAVAEKSMPVADELAIVTGLVDGEKV